MSESVKATTCDFTNLHKAMRKCRKGVTWKDSVSRYCNNSLASILKLCNALDSETYTLDDYYKFTIYEPKKREIVSTKFKDRVFQRSLCDQHFYAAVTRSFIYDNCACQVNKGTTFSRDRLETHLHKYYRKHGPSGFVLKIDFKNYFGSTPHQTAKAALAKVNDDQWALSHASDIIDSYSNPEDPGVGLGLGSQITQLVQLLVLNDLDHYIKEELKAKYYVRYMDDMVILHPDKEYLKKCLIEIDRIAMSMGLSLNKKKTQIFKIEQGIVFLGFKFGLSETGNVFRIITKKNVKKRKRKLRKYKDLVFSGFMTKEKSDECYESWKAHAETGNSYDLIASMDKYYHELWEDYYV